MVRLGFNLASGDTAYKGGDESPSPGSSSDIDWSRSVYTLEFHHQLNSSFGFGGTVPFYDMEVFNRQKGTEDQKSAFGDIGFYAVWAPWEATEPHDPDGFFSLHNLSLLAGLSVPTGNERKGDAPANHFNQLSSGSIDVRLGATYNGSVADGFCLFVGTSLLVDGGSDSSGFRNGTIYDFRIGGSYAPVDFASVFVDLDVLIRERNYQSGSELGSSGGSWGFLELGATVTPGKGFFVEGSVAIPIYRRVNLEQPVSDAMWSLGVGVQF